MPKLTPEKEERILEQTRQGRTRTGISFGGGNLSWMDRRIIAAAFTLIAIVAFGIYNKESSQSELKNAIETHVLPQAPGYQERKDYIVSLLEKFHRAAFNEAYSVDMKGGGKRARINGKLNDQLYIERVFSSMAGTARRDGHYDLAEFLDDRKEVILYELRNQK